MASEVEATTRAEEMEQEEEDPIDAYMRELEKDAVKQEKADAQFDFSRSRRRRQLVDTSNFPGSEKETDSEVKRGGSSTFIDQSAVDEVVDAVMSRLTLEGEVILSQRGEPEPATVEKRKVLTSLLSSRPAAFLDKYGGVLGLNELSHFSGTSETDIEIWTRLKRLRHQLILKTKDDELQDGTSGNAVDAATKALKQALKEHHSSLVRNRRYRKLQLLLEENRSDPDQYYFSEKNMRQREPALYHYYVGQYTEHNASRAAYLGGRQEYWSHILESYDHEDQEARRKAAQEKWNWKSKYEKQQEQEERKREEDAFEEEFDTDSEEGEEAAAEKGNMVKSIEKEKEDEQEDEPQDMTEVTQEYLDSMRFALVDVMMQRFLSGLDKDYFDYSTVDTNEELDDMALLNGDREEMWFDDEPPSSSA